MGYIGYLREGNVVRIFLECCDQPEPRYTYAIDVVFAERMELQGIRDVLCLKKFYKLVNSLEERAREHGRPWQGVFDSPDALLEHLRWTRNSREFPPGHPPRTA